MRILTAGISVLEREKFKDSSNYDSDKAYYLNKPRGFIWGSTLIKRDGKAYSDWIRFVENEQFHPKNILMESAIHYIRMQKYVLYHVKKII